MQKASKNTLTKSAQQPTANKSRSTPSKPSQDGKKFAQQSRQQSVGSNHQQKIRSLEPRSQNGRFVHREFLGNLSLSGGGFTVLDRFRLNPGSAKTFPWLSRIALNYENYKFHKLKFHFISRLATNQNSAFIMSPDYDAADKAPVNEREFSANVDTVENTGWANLSITLSPARMNRLFKSHTCMSDSRFQTTEQDQKTIDAGFLNIAYDSTLIVALGKLWVEYDVEFHEPQYATESPAFGGQGTNKLGALNSNTTQVFVDNELQTNLEEEVPVLRVLPPTSFPGPNLFEFTRDWSGFLTRKIQGTNISDIGRLTLNNVVSGTNTLNATYNGTGTDSQAQEWINAKAGDLLGNQAISATTLARFILNLGGSNVA